MRALAITFKLSEENYKYNKRHIFEFSRWLR